MARYLAFTFFCIGTFLTSVTLVVKKHRLLIWETETQPVGAFESSPMRSGRFTEIWFWVTKQELFRDVLPVAWAFLPAKTSLHSSTSLFTPSLLW